MNPLYTLTLIVSTSALRDISGFFFAMYRFFDICIILSIPPCALSLLKAKWFSKGSETSAGKCPNAGRSLNVLDKCAVCKGANLISMVWIFKGITCCNCLTEESINHCSVRSSCNFFANVGIYFPSILFFFSFNLARSFKRLIAAVFKNNKLISHVPTWRLNNYTYQTCPSPPKNKEEGGCCGALRRDVTRVCHCYAAYNMIGMVHYTPIMRGFSVQPDAQCRLHKPPSLNCWYMTRK